MNKKEEQMEKWKLFLKEKYDENGNFKHEDDQRKWDEHREWSKSEEAQELYAQIRYEQEKKDGYKTIAWILGLTIIIIFIAGISK
ncbi:hypothetical protein [Chengkuizengella marina]|uniref:Uncharacterized protein n=1 Tax=Chengkuizengella marina TaxID=2507566 RepID=A0A6N9PYQ1_9BACL|nr:hypothetical protein [Chengkuizengella marina]NBI28649.1 hypothetical protein [Chengkuizengella marina]